MCVNVRSCGARRERKVQTVVRSLYHRNPPRFSEPQMRLLSFDHNNSTKHNINGIYVKLEDLIILNKDTIIQDGNLYLSRNRPACSKQNYKQNTHLRKIQTSLYAPPRLLVWTFTNSKRKIWHCEKLKKMKMKNPQLTKAKS